MFGGFNSIPRKPGEHTQKPLGVIPNPVGAPGCPKGHPGPAGPPGATPAAAKAPSSPAAPKTALQPHVPAPRAPEGLQAHPTAEIEALWDGVIHGWSGYAKSNRELLKRVSAYANIRYADDAYFDPTEKEPKHLELFKFHRGIHVSSRAPRITFLPPKEEQNYAGYRIIYTMMETDPKVDSRMIALMNERYNECWVPTKWNAGTFQRSGLQIPTYVMPLGVDQSVYHPEVKPFIPKCTLMTGKDSGRMEIPKGFLFINVFQPSFRKGHDVLIECFEEAFGDDRDAGLILGTTAYSLEGQFPWKSMQSRIWTLGGGYSESQLASIYKGCNAYVTAARAEGWNLPLGEAGGVGLPVIAPYVTSHPEVMPRECGYYFEKDSTRVFPGSEKVCEWFRGFAFADYGPKSRKQLIGLMKRVKAHYSEAEVMGRRYREHVAKSMTWGISAKKIVQRLKVICARRDA